MKLVVGLGNPGRKYQQTRHNVGFQVIDKVANRYAVGSARAKFQGELIEAAWNGERVLLLRPLTYMNRSGMSVLAARDFYKIENVDLLVVCDDFNLPLAKLRVRAKGSSGGQKGLQDIVRCLGTEQFARLRIGIGFPPEHWEVSDFVLSRFRGDELEPIEDAIERAADAVAMWARDGVEVCMNQFNAS